MNFRNALILFILLSSTHFFKLIYLPRAITIIALVGSSFLVAIAVIILSIYDKKTGFLKNFQLEISFFMIAFVFSILGAKIGHNQNIIITIMSQKFMLFFLLYFLLHYLKIKPGALEGILLIVAIMFIVVFLSQYILYPKLIVNSRVESSRGTIRIFFPGDGIGKLMFFYCLYHFFRTRKIYYLVYCLIFISLPILQGTRNQILSIFFVTLLFLLFNKQVKSKVIIMFVVAICGIIMFIIFQDILLGLVNASEEQASKNEDDIRIRSIRFFLFEFPPHYINYLIGNGVAHGSSSYGLKEMYYKSAYKFFISDIGLIGAYTQFGVIFVIANIITLKKLFKIKIEPTMGYIKYWVVIVLLELPLGSPFGRPDDIVVMAIVLYLVDVSYYNLNYKNQYQKKVISNIK